MLFLTSSVILDVVFWFFFSKLTPIIAVTSQQLIVQEEVVSRRSDLISSQTLIIRDHIGKYHFHRPGYLGLSQGLVS